MRDKAKENDNFDELISLRDSIVWVRDLARKIVEYEQMKVVAIEQEDYEVAKKLKQAIENSKREISVYPIEGK